MILKENELKTILIDNKHIFELKIVKVEENSLVLSIGGVLLIINLQDTKQIDLDSDGINDLEIKFDGVDNYNKVIRVIVKRIFIPKYEELKQELIVRGQETIPEKFIINKQSIWNDLFGILLILIICCAIYPMIDYWKR